MSPVFLSLFEHLLFREEKEKWVRAKYEGKEFLQELPPCDFSLGEVSEVSLIEEDN